MKSMKILSILLAIILLNACVTTKYIPKSYFDKRHSLNVAVKPLPAASLIESCNSGGEGLLSAIISAAASSSRSQDLAKTFAHIDQEGLKDELQNSIKAKIKDFYDVNSDERDLRATITIHSWGWILPTASFGIRVGSYQLQITGTVKVYDLKDAGKEIANISLRTNEEMKDNLDQKETTRKVKKGIEEFAELCAEFLWRSAEDCPPKS